MFRIARLLSLALIAALFVSACSGQTASTATPTSIEPDATATTEATPDPTPEPTGTPTPEPTAEPTPVSSTFAVGDVITITEGGDPWADFTVLEVQQATEFVDPEGYFNDTPQTAGYVYLAAHVQYTALVDGVDYNPFDFQVFVDGRAIDGYAFALNGPQPELSSGTLPATRVADGWILYEVPPTGEVLLSYSGNVFSNDAPVFEVVLRDS
jgi:hypothetical protein